MTIIQVAFIFNVFIAEFLSQDIPCYDGWLYSKFSGKCYKPINNETSQQQASLICSNLLPISTIIKPRLIRLQNINDGPALADQMISVGNNEKYWLDAQNNSGTWQWGDGSPVNLSQFNLIVPQSDTTSPCLKFNYYFTNVGNVYTKQYEITSASCSSNGYFVCEHESKLCDPVVLSYVPENMQLVPNSVSVFSYVYVSCKPGFYRLNEFQASSQIQGGKIPKNYAYCTGTSSITKDPNEYKSQWNTTEIEKCQSVTCPAFTGMLNNVVDQIPTITDSSVTFPFGYKFNLSCVRGYVSYNDNKKLNSSLTCQQSPIDKTLGVWVPQDYTPCVAIQCNMTALQSMTPINAELLSARNKVTQQQYAITLQRSFLTLFNNIITFQCLDGFFFPDRSWAKQVICELANDSLISGDWQGYQGTSLPLFPSCENATCKYESILITYDMNLKPFFEMMNSVGAYVNQTNPDGNPYPYQTRLMFKCKDGYNTGSGKVSQNLECGPKGNWVPNLTPCIPIIPPINTGSAQHFVPPPIEAASAQQIGCVAIVILVVFLSLIVILDMSTLPRDIKLMKNNIQNLKRVINSKN